MFAVYQRWKHRRLAKSVSITLKELFGKSEFYSAAQLDEAAAMIGLTSKQREMAYAMFANEEACNGFLSRMRSSKTASELRGFLAANLFGGTVAVGYECSWNRFHDFNNDIMGGLSTLSSDGSSGSESWSDGGGFDSGGAD